MTTEHDDRDRRRRLLRRLRRCSTDGDDGVDLQTDEVGREGRVPIILALRPSGLDGDALTFHVAQLAQTLAEGVEAAQSGRVGRGTRREIPDAELFLPGLGRGHVDRHGQEENRQRRREVGASPH